MTEITLKDSVKNSLDYIQSHREKIKFYTKEGAQFTGQGAAIITLRMLSWGVTGFVFALITWNSQYWTNFMMIEAIPIHPLVYQLTFLALYLIVGMIVLGYVGVWRGIGRTVLYAGVKKGFVLYLVDAILDKFTGVLRKSNRIDRVMNDTQLNLENLPLQVWEDNLKLAVTQYLKKDDPSLSGIKRFQRRIAGTIKRLLCRRIEFFLLAIVRQEATNSGGGGISIQRVREVALRKIEGFFRDWIVGLMNKQLMIGFLILVGVYSLVPLTAYFF
jgi:hypothetical protein